MPGYLLNVSALLKKRCIEETALIADNEQDLQHIVDAAIVHSEQL